VSPEKFTKLTSKTLVLAQENIDTDQIIPARFLTTTSKKGLGRAAFYDWRYDEAGMARNSDPFAGKDDGSFQILVGGDNFGCGSSREHAPWALSDFGFRVIVSTKIADIFKSNALKNGIIPIEVSAEILADLMGTPGAEVCVDLQRCEISRPGRWKQSFEIDRFGRNCLLDGVDPLGFLQNCEAEITRFEAKMT
jgi:3-isopropylmalate/(R)-2-methylmalate dehydratase small subunit